MQLMQEEYGRLLYSDLQGCLWTKKGCCASVPHMPPEWNGLTFRIHHLDSWLEITVHADNSVEVKVLEGGSVEIRIQGEKVTVRREI